MIQTLRTFFYDGEKPARLDLFLTEQFSLDSELKQWTRSRIKNLIRSGQVQVGGKAVIKSGITIKPGEEVVVCGLFTESSSPLAWDFAVPIIFEDDDLIVVNKPAGITMHPGAGNKSQTLVNALVGHFSADLKEGDNAARAGIVHRLDKDTTGLVVIAKNAEAQSALSSQFSARTVGKTYVALALCTPRGRRILNKNDKGTIEAAIGRHPRARTKMAISANGGRSAVTHWQVLQRMHYACLVEINLATGRTHQIRVHFDSIGSPLIGDKTYGDFSSLPSPLKRTEEAFGRQALHAKKLRFSHPRTQKEMQFEADLPQDFKALINEFRKYQV